MNQSWSSNGKYQTRPRTASDETTNETVFSFSAEHSTPQDSQPVTQIVLRICFATQVTFHHARPCEMLWNTVELLLQTAGVWSHGLDGSSNVCIQRIVPLSWNCPHVCRLLEDLILVERLASITETSLRIFTNVVISWNPGDDVEMATCLTEGEQHNSTNLQHKASRKWWKKKTLEALWLPRCCIYTDVTSFRNFRSVVWSRNKRSNHSLFTHSALCPTLISVRVFSPFLKIRPESNALSQTLSSFI